MGQEKFSLATKLEKVVANGHVSLYCYTGMGFDCFVVYIFMHTCICCAGLLFISIKSKKCLKYALKF